MAQVLKLDNSQFNCLKLELHVALLDATVNRLEATLDIPGATIDRGIGAIPGCAAVDWLDAEVEHKSSWSRIVGLIGRVYAHFVKGSYSLKNINNNLESYSPSMRKNREKIVLNLNTLYLSSLSCKGHCLILNIIQPLFELQLAYLFSSLSREELCLNQ